MVPFDTPEGVREVAEDWVVAATIATEVPPVPTKHAASKDLFTAGMILAAQQAVAEVMFNRQQDKRFPKTAMGVVLAPKQFSAVMRGLSAAALGHHDIWLGAMEGSWFPQHVAECLAMWRRVKAREVTPLVPYALWYFSPVSMRPALSSPSWVTGKTAVPCTAISGDYFRFFS
jgi:hypothetical protein